MAHFCLSSRSMHFMMDAEQHHELSSFRGLAKAFEGLLLEANLIGSEWISDFGNGVLEVVDPAGGGVVGTVPRAGTADVRQAIEVAGAAFLKWRAEPARSRSEALQRWHDLIIEHRSNLAALLTAEQGKPLSEALAEIDYAASFVRWYAGEAERVSGRLALSANGLDVCSIQKVPVGVVAAITPWNAPSSMVTRKVAPALAAGCTVVLKPAESTPFSALALAKLALKAGIGPGVLNVVTGDAEAIGAVLTSSPIVRKISFTGSTRVALHLLSAASKSMKRVSLEAGGNAPFIVLPDADMDVAVTAAMVAKFRAGGQSCVAANRFLIAEERYEEFVERVTERVVALRTGSGHTDPDIGPVIDQNSAQRIGELIDEAVSAGARLICGGYRRGTAFVDPAVVRDVTPQMRIYHEEVFGPVATVSSFRDIETLVHDLNQEDTGLVAYLIGQDEAVANHLADRLEVGMVGINTGLVSDASMPFGGVKCSGLGREGGVEGIEAYLEAKYIKTARQELEISVPKRELGQS
ncbi:NAD-dependent succinate-semialdehyde dehydrogenase [Marinibacterium sp. SX1]|uniref:NAD-dependent succinate-semialdehyde dehydrogenase n=1 Tax=Marinibacterium sp. SX1 TaxID=3388424 RepID=UPI003D171C10